MNVTKYSKTKMDSKTEMKAELYLQNKTKPNLFSDHQYQYQECHIHEIFFLCCYFW